MINKTEKATVLPYLTFRNFSRDYRSGEVLVINSGAPIIPYIDYQRFYEAVKNRIQSDGTILMEKGIRTKKRIPVDEEIFSTEEARQNAIEQLADIVHLRGAWASNCHTNPEAAAYHEGMAAQALAPYRKQQDILDTILQLTQKASEQGVLPHEYRRGIGSSRVED